MRSSHFTTRVPDKCNTNATRVRHERHECYTIDTSATRVLHERHEWDTSRKFDFDNDTSKNKN